MTSCMRSPIFESTQNLEIWSGDISPAVTVTAPEKWNSIKGTISGPGLRTMTDFDIVDCAVDDDGIISVFHWTRINNVSKVREPGNTVVLTFNKKKRPSFVYIGLERFPVSVFYPKALR